MAIDPNPQAGPRPAPDRPDPVVGDLLGIAHSQARRMLDDVHALGRLYSRLEELEPGRFDPRFFVGQVLMSFGLEPRDLDDDFPRHRTAAGPRRRPAAAMPPTRTIPTAIEPATAVRALRLARDEDGG